MPDRPICHPSRPMLFLSEIYNDPPLSPPLILGQASVAYRLYAETTACEGWLDVWLPPTIDAYACMRYAKWCLESQSAQQSTLTLKHPGYVAVTITECTFRQACNLQHDPCQYRSREHLSPNYSATFDERNFEDSRKPQKTVKYWI